jgi:hypothetical protein
LRKESLVHNFVPTSWPRGILIRRALGTLFIALLALSTVPATYAAPMRAFINGVIPPSGTYRTVYLTTTLANQVSGAVNSYSGIGLPPGLSLVRVNGGPNVGNLNLSGTPTLAGTFTFTVTATFTNGTTTTNSGSPGIAVVDDQVMRLQEGSKWQIGASH